MRRSPTERAREWFEVYTRDLSGEDLKRLFTQDTPDAYAFFARTTDEDAFAALPLWKRIPLRFRQVFVAFTLRLPAARRALFIGALVIALVGILKLFQGFALVRVPLGTPFFHVGLPLPHWADGTVALLVSIVLLVLLVLLEVADRLTLKGELEIAREIQLAMLPEGTYTSGGIQVCGVTRPANTVGGDFYDVLPRPDGRVVLALGDVAGKGSPAALLMALLLAVLRTLVDENLEPEALADRLNVQICRHTPATRFITLFYAEYFPDTGMLRYVNGGQNPPLIRRANGTYEELGSTGVAMGMFEQSKFSAARTELAPGDMLVMYSDGITEAEDPQGRPLEEPGLQTILDECASASPDAIARHVLKAVEKYTTRTRFLDDLTILVAKRAT